MEGPVCCLVRRGEGEREERGVRGMFGLWKLG